MMTSEMSMSGANVGGRFEGLLAGIDGAGFKAALVENHSQRVGDHSFVVGNQHLGFGVFFGHTLLDG